MNGGIGLTRNDKSPTVYKNEFLGIKGASFDILAATGSVAGVSQRMYGVLIGVKPGETIAGIYFYVNTLAASTSLCKVAAFDSSNALLGKSADIHATVEATLGYTAAPFTSTITAPADGVIYGALLTVGTTPPDVFRAPGTSGYFDHTTPSGKIYTWSMSSQADIPATVVPSASNTVKYVLAAY